MTAVWPLRVARSASSSSGGSRTLQIWTSKTVKGGKREAQRALAALVAASDDGGVAPTSGTVSELLKRWFENSSDLDFKDREGREEGGAAGACRPCCCLR